MVNFYFWERDLADRQVLVSGPYLVRSANIVGHTIELTGDLDAATTLEVFVPESVHRVVWNGVAVDSQRTPYGTLTARLPGPAAAQLPAHV